MKTKQIIFKIDSEPVGKGRPRFSRYNGKPYTPERTERFEKYVRMCYRSQAGTNYIGGNVPIKVEICAFYRIAQRVSKKNRLSMLKWIIKPTKKPDADNVAKIILDALNGFAWQDDAQITDLRIIKRYSDEPCVVVEISEDTEPWRDTDSN